MSSAESRRFGQVAQYDHREASRYCCEACNSLGVRGSDAQDITLEDDHEPWNDGESISQTFATRQAHVNECCTCECVSFAVIHQTCNRIQQLPCKSFHASVFSNYISAATSLAICKEKGLVEYEVNMTYPDTCSLSSWLIEYLIPSS